MNAKVQEKMLKINVIYPLLCKELKKNRNFITMWNEIMNAFLERIKKYYG